MSHQLQNALRTLAEAMRGNESPEHEHDEIEGEPEGDDRPMRTMSYLLDPAKGKSQRPIVNVAHDDAPLVIGTGFLLRAPEKKAAQ